MVSLGVLVCACALIGLAAATNVKQCPGKSFNDLSNNVTLTCTKLPCKLKKGTDQHITVKFTPEKDVEELRNHVVANVLGVPLPFVGVDGNNICDKIELENGEKPGCPLKAGTTYVYDDKFPVHPWYPSIPVDVLWALTSGNNKKYLMCFGFPAKIIT